MSFIIRNACKFLPKYKNVGPYTFEGDGGGGGGKKFVHF